MLSLQVGDLGIFAGHQAGRSVEKEAEEHSGAERNSSFGQPLWFINCTFDIAEGKFICLWL